MHECCGGRLRPDNAPLGAWVGRGLEGGAWVVGGFHSEVNPAPLCVVPTQSPVYAHFSETLNGTVSIRAYRDQARFVSVNAHRVDVRCVRLCVVMVWLHCHCASVLLYPCVTPLCPVYAPPLTTCLQSIKLLYGNCCESLACGSSGAHRCVCFCRRRVCMSCARLRTVCVPLLRPLCMHLSWPVAVIQSPYPPPRPL